MQAIEMHYPEIEPIRWNHEELKQWLLDRTEQYHGLVVTADKEQIQDAKKHMADMRKLRKALEDERIKAKKKILKPYDDFAVKEKELIQILDDAIQELDVQVKEYDEMLRQEKLEKAKEIYKEEIGNLDRTIPFEKVYQESWLNKTKTLKSIREEVANIRDKVDADLKLINMESSAYAFEMKEEYMKSFDLTAAMAKKQELEEAAKRKAAFEEQRKKREEERQKRLEEEAKMVHEAGQAETDRQSATNMEKEATHPARRKRVVVSITANMSQFSDLNRILNMLREHAEEVRVLRTEEL